MRLEIDICSSCRRKKHIHQVKFVENHLNKIYWKECYAELDREINCKFCGLKIHNDYYRKHLMDFDRDSYYNEKLFSNTRIN